MSIINWPEIGGNSEFPLPYNSKVSIQSTSSVHTAANVVFTLGFSEAGRATLIDMEPEKGEITPSDSHIYQMQFEKIQADVANIAWSSSNETVAVVTDAGIPNRSLAGIRNVKVSAKGLGKTLIRGVLPDGTAAEIEIEIKALTPKSLELTKAPTKTEYGEGSNFETAGMVVTATYNNNTTSIIPLTDLLLTGDKNLPLTQKSVQASFQGLSVNIPIVVKSQATDDKYFTMGNKQIRSFDFDMVGEPMDVVIGTVIKGERVDSIGPDAFWHNGSGNLRSVTMPSTLRVIWPSAFNTCELMTSVKLNAGLVEIGEHAFQNCRALTSIRIPASVQTIDVTTFENCTSLANIYLEGPRNPKSPMPYVVVMQRYTGTPSVHVGNVVERGERGGTWWKPEHAWETRTSSITNQPYAHLRNWVCNFI